MSTRSRRGRALTPRPLTSFDAKRPVHRYQRVQHALRRRRRLRNGLVQILYIVPAIGLALLMPSLDVGPDVDGGRAIGLFFSLASGLIAFIALVFSLLFLVVPYANTTLTPRLTLFRDHPIVWHSFAYFVALFIFFATAGLALNADDEVSTLVPVTGLVLIVVALGVVRVLQFRAYRSLQLGGTLTDITGAGERVLDALYVDGPGLGTPLPEPPPVAREVRWPQGLGVLRQIDVVRLLRLATARDMVIELRVGVGEELRHDVVVMALRGEPGEGADDEFLRSIESGSDRSFDQDPLFAFRLLVDIGLRALSTAINDPFTAVQAIGGVHELLQAVMRHDLDIGHIIDGDGDLRLVLKVPTWEDYLAIGVDELVPWVDANPLAKRRLTEMVEALLETAPPDRRAGLEERQHALAADVGGAASRRL